MIKPRPSQTEYSNLTISNRSRSSRPSYGLSRTPTTLVGVFFLFKEVHLSHIVRMSPPAFAFQGRNNPSRTAVAILSLRCVLCRPDSRQSAVQRREPRTCSIRAYPELTAGDVAALRNYARWPVGLRRSFGAWADEAEELDKFLDWNRQQRKLDRRGMDE